jgi:hypothetical protein
MYCLFADCIRFEPRRRAFYCGRRHRFEPRRRASCCGRRQGCCVCSSSSPVWFLSRFALLKLGCSQGDIHARGIAGYSGMLIPSSILFCLPRVYVIPLSCSTHSHAHIRARMCSLQPALPITQALPVPFPYFSSCLPPLLFFLYACLTLCLSFSLLLCFFFFLCSCQCFYISLNPLSQTPPSAGAHANPLGDAVATDIILRQCVNHHPLLERAIAHRLAYSPESTYNSWKNAQLRCLRYFSSPFLRSTCALLCMLIFVTNCWSIPLIIARARQICDRHK